MNHYLVKKKLPLCLLQCVDFLLSPLRKKVPIEKIEKILLCNIAHLGDVVIATTVLPILKEALPHVKIGFLTSSASSCVVEGHPAISWFHTVDHWKLNRTRKTKLQKTLHYYATKAKAAKEIKQIGYDVAIDLYPFFPNAIPLLWGTKIPVRIGYASGGFGPLLTHPMDWHNRKQYMADYHFALLEQLSLNHVRSDLRFSLPSINAVNRWSLEENYLIFHMGSGALQKQWSETGWRDVAMVIQGKQIVFTGKGSEENARIERVAKGLSHCLNLCDQLSWKELCGVVSKAKGVISVDSAIVHLAAAFDVPCATIIVDLSNDLLLWTPPHTQRLICPTTNDLLSTCAAMDTYNKLDHNE
jgi:ADP-heptose:LPS heptosyltransferase